MSTTLTKPTTARAKVIKPRLFRPSAEVMKVLGDPHSKDYVDLRDRAAFVHVTGTLPTHLRTHMTSLLRAISQVRATPTAMDGKSGAVKLEPHIARSLRVLDHPMVKKVSEFIAEGYAIASTRELKSRRPFSRVFLYREGKEGMYRMTVHSNGAIREGWDGIGE